MSKLEDKLAASIKPDRPEPAAPPSGTAAPRRSKPRKPAAKPAAASDAPADLNAPGVPLHPSRIWPD